jgi:hypothetical protein
MPKNLDVFTILAAAGVLMVVAAVLLAIREIDLGGDYAFWYALIDLVPIAVLGVLVLLCALRVGNAPWGDGLLRAVPALGIAAVAATAALVLKDVVDEFDSRLWDPLEDIVYYIPVSLGLLLYLSARPREDRIFGRPTLWGRWVAVAVLAIALIVAIHDALEADSDAFWAFIGGLALPAGFALLLLGSSLEPAGRREHPAQLPGSLPPLDDPKLADWVAWGGVAVLAAGLLLGLKALSDGDDAIWRFLRVIGYHTGIGLAVLMASGGRLGNIVPAAQPAVRVAALAAIGATVLAGLKFTIDADSAHFWVFVDDVIAFSALGVLAYAMYEAAGRIPALLSTGLSRSDD